MGFRVVDIFFRQTWALAKKTLLIVVVRRWNTTLIRAVLLPVAFMVLLANLKNFLAPSNGYGIGSRLPVQSLVSNVPQNEKLVFVQTPGLGSDVFTVVEKLSVPLRAANKTLVYLTQVEDLITTCKESLQGVSDCFAAVVFNDSPLTTGNSGIWNYTIRTDSALDGSTFHVNQQNNDQQRVILPLQVAIDNAITNSSIIPNEYMFTTISQSTASDNVRKLYQGLIISTYGIVFFITTVSSIYHLAGMISTDRESGMTQLIDAMGGSAASRICSYILAFNIVYLPSWIVIGILYGIEVYPKSNMAISIFWQVFTGMALTSATVFAAMFFNRAQLSGVYCTVGFLIIGVIGMIIDRGTPPTAVVAVLSLIFPSMNYIFFSGFISRYERQDLATDLVHAPKATSDQNSTSSVNGLELFVFLWIQILVYPVLAYFAEKVIHGASSRNRTTGIRPGTEDSMNVIEILGLSKIYRPRLLKRWFSLGKVSDVIAVSSLDLVAVKGHILCLLGANGSGKTTTLDMIGGLQNLTQGSIHINVLPSQIGICPQRNVLWDELTVEEHVHLWNEIKSSHDDKSALESLIEACDLSLKKNARSETLSGGQKRKLQLACMYVGGSSVCLMDEVSSGLDPLSRRVIWNIILAERSKRTVILTTHFLDEADVLSDHIAIMSHGHLKCEGSSVDLKTRLGGGYEVHLPGIPNGPDLKFPTRCYKGETVYNTTDSSEAAILLSSLESEGYTNVFVNGPTVENVFLQVVQDSPDNHSAFHGPHEKFNTQITESSLNDSDMKLSSGQDISFFRQTQILFHKRFTVLMRNWLPYLIALVMPIAVTPGVQSLLQGYNAPQCSGVSVVDPNKAQPINIMYDAQQTGNLQLVAGPDAINETLYKVVTQFPVGYGLNFSNYTNQFLFEDSFASFQHHVAALFTNVTPGALYMMPGSTPTYAYAGDFGILSAMLMQNLWTQIRSGLRVAVYNTPFDSLYSVGAGNSIQYIVYCCLAYAVYPAFFALYPTREKLHKVRALQYSNGVRAAPLWFAYALFDFLIVLPIAAVCTAVISQQAKWWFGAAYLFPVLALYGLASILFVYAVSLVASSQLAAFAFAAGTQAVMFLLSLMAFILTENYIPTGQLQMAVDAITFALNIIFPVGNVTRSFIVGFNLYQVNCRNNQYISSGGSIYAYGGSILYLCIQIFVLFGLILLLEGGYFPRFFRRAHLADDTEHETHFVADDVEHEGKRVEESDSDFLRVLHLTKRFGSNVAVDNVSFGVSPGEIFALLGPNGAGKSTLINMMRGELLPNHGTVLLEGEDIVKNMRSARQYLGLCPQFDALDLMTTREHLEFYARAKGVETVAQDVDAVIGKVGLEEYGNRLASELSGGNKRKLSLAIALIGNPTVLILDEPSSSMDAASKRIMWKTLTEVTTGRSLILTTHSMEEADALATRAGIIATRLLALGTTDYLRKKYGNVYHIHLSLKTAPISTAKEMEMVKEWISRFLVGVKFESHGSNHGQIRFSVPVGFRERELDDFQDPSEKPRSVVATRVDVGKQGSGIGALFSLLEANKEILGLEFYSVGATTLDQVFLNVVTDNNVREEGYVITQRKRGRKWLCF
ncbi:hypothetical protein V1505DRAFT_379941 [Lipomyces doorenjongii]